MRVITRAAGHAVGVARKVLPGGNAAATEPEAPAAPTQGNKPAAAEVAARTATKPTAEKTAAKKTAAKRTPAKKTPTKTVANKASKTEKASPVAKKTTAPAIDVAQLRVKEGEEAWQQAELDEILEELQAQREHSLAILEAQEAELSGLMRDPGDGAGQDQADVGSTSFERDQELTVVNSEREKLDQIERALQSLHEGTYGICESCGEPIGKMRLLAFPRATLCLPCKQREERR